MNIQTLL